MSLVIGIKDRATGKYIIASDGLYKSNSCQYSKFSPRTFNIQKFNNVSVAFNGNLPLFQDLVKEIDFDSIPSEPTKRYLYDNVYVPMMKAMLKYGYSQFDEGSKVLSDFSFDMLLLASNGLFDICDEKIYHPEGAAELYGTNEYTIIVGLYDAYYEEMETIDLIKLMYKVASKKYANVGYPHLYTYQDSDELHLIDDCNNEQVVKFEQLYSRRTK